MNKILTDFIASDKQVIEYKLKKDFKNYLNSGREVAISNGNYIIYAVSENFDKEKGIEINENDILTLLYMNIIKDYYGISPVPVRIDVALGRFNPPDKNGFFEVEKCCATFFYDINIDLIKIDFYYNGLYGWQNGK